MDMTAQTATDTSHADAENQHNAKLSGAL